MNRNDFIDVVHSVGMPDLRHGAAPRNATNSARAAITSVQEGSFAGEIRILEWSQLNEVTSRTNEHRIIFQKKEEN
jgi:hypothetical protein